jgi:formate hydrogenlyase transcriptional activator
VLCGRLGRAGRCPQLATRLGLDDGFALRDATRRCDSARFRSARVHLPWNPSPIKSRRLRPVAPSQYHARLKDQTSQAPAPASAAVDDRLQFESLVADVSARFVNLPADQVDAAIEAAQRQIVESLGLDRSTLFELLPDGSTLVFTHYWARPGFPEPPKSVELYEHFPWIGARVLRREIVSYTSLTELPPDCPDLKSLRAIGSTSLVSVPLEVGGQVVGILNFGTLGRERHWQPEVVNRFRRIAQVFAGALARKRGDLALRAALTEVEQLRDRLRDENEYLKREVISLHGTSQIVGQSETLKRVLLRAQQVAATDATVLLLGETGTGKELLAAQIHDLSARRGRLMVRVNCAAIPAALLESELRRSSFTSLSAHFSRRASTP